MGKVSDQLENQSLQNWAIIALLAVVAVGMVGSQSMNIFSSGEDQADAPDVGDFVEIDYNEYTTDFEVLAEGATEVHFVNAEELPEEYGDYTESASAITDELDSDEVESVAVSDDKATVDATEIGENEFFVAGETYDVIVEGDHLTFEEVTVPETIEKFAYEQGNAQTESVEVMEAGAASVDSEEVLTADGETAGEDTTVNTGLDSRVTTIEEDDEFSFEAEVEVEDGTALFGAAEVTQAGDSVEEVAMTVRADGEVVYSDSASEDFTDLGDDFVEEEMEYNPVMAEDDIIVTLDVEYDSETADGDLLGISVDNLDDDSEFYSAVLSYQA